MMIPILFTVFVFFGLLLLLRVLKGPTIWDRLLGFNLFSVILIILILLMALRYDLPYLVDIALVYTLLGCVSIIFITRFVQRKGKL